MRKVALLLGAVCALGLPLTAPASAQQAPPKIAGNWTVKIHSTTEGILEQRWSIKQEGNKITGTAKAKNGDLPLEGAFTGAVLHAMIMDGDMKYQVIATVANDEIDGTIRMGKNEFLLAARRAK